MIYTITGCSDDEYNEDCVGGAAMCPNQSVFEFDTCEIDGDHFYKNVYYLSVDTGEWETDPNEFYCDGDNCSVAAKNVIITACPNVDDDTFDDGLMSVK